MMTSQDERDYTEFDRILSLVFDHDVEDLSEHDRRVLNDALRSDDTACRRYLQQARLMSMIASTPGAEIRRNGSSAAPLTDVPADRGTPHRDALRPSRAHLRLTVPVAIAATIGLLVAGALFGRAALPDSAGPTEHHWLKPPIATVSSLDGARWDHEVLPLELGTPLFPMSRFTLQEGSIELQTPNGSVITLDAPTTLRMVRENELLVEAGSVYVHAGTAAEEVIVLTPTMRIVDLGTEFGVQANRDGSAGVAVFGGLVRVESPYADIDADIMLRTGEALVVRKPHSNKVPDVTQGRFTPPSAPIPGPEIQHRLSGIFSEAAPRVASLNQNMLVNGGAEAYSLRSDDALLPAADFFGWSRFGRVFHNAYSEFPLQTPLPENTGSSYFFGGADDRSVLSQTVDLRFASDLIDRGLTQADLSALVGGYLFFAIDADDRVRFDDFELHDPARVTVTFFDEQLSSIGSLSLGPVELNDIEIIAGPNTLGNVAAPLESSTAVPPLARSARVELEFGRTRGRFSNGIVDNVTLVLRCTADFDRDGAVTDDDRAAFELAARHADPLADLAAPFGEINEDDHALFDRAFESGCEASTTP